MINRERRMVQWFALVAAAAAKKLLAVSFQLSAKTAAISRRICRGEGCGGRFFSRHLPMVWAENVKLRGQLLPS